MGRRQIGGAIDGCGINRIQQREGSFYPRMPDGKRKKFNVYAKAREECESKLGAFIEEKKVEIKAEKEILKKEGRKIKSGRPSRSPVKIWCAVGKERILIKQPSMAKTAFISMFYFAERNSQKLVRVCTSVLPTRMPTALSTLSFFCLQNNSQAGG